MLFIWMNWFFRKIKKRFCNKEGDNYIIIDNKLFKNYYVYGIFKIIYIKFVVKFLYKIIYFESMKEIFVKKIRNIKIFKRKMCKMW